MMVSQCILIWPRPSCEAKCGTSIQNSHRWDELARTIRKQLQAPRLRN
ncbi:hemimethylated DNA binding protein YccV [Salmonella enterica subsp. enterica]|uniref:Hemimethylated DNA binding protein YccV n=1 Tax=Salmonella enterica I TaxID=59201 RepID=A0A379WY13_SALET|nr:hemimethylated DNA binding protein YccV [Salmonella enterica subsp. enterica]